MNDTCALSSKLRAKFQDLGMRVEPGDDDLFIRASREQVLTKWALGGRSISYRASIRLDPAKKNADFREVIIEESWGLVPPHLWMEVSFIKKFFLSGHRVEQSPWGSGALSFEEIREAIRDLVVAEGWSFHLELARMP